MKTLKEKAIALVLIGLAIQFIPLFIIGLLFLSFNVKNSPPNLLLSFLILDLFLLGYIFFIKGCCLYAKSKGYSSKWGSIGLLSVFSLPILLFLPPKKNSFSLQLEKLPNNPFEKINIPEDSLTIFIAMPVLLYSAFTLFFLLNKTDFSNVFKDLSFTNSFNIVVQLSWVCIFLPRYEEIGLNFNKIIGYKNPLNLKLISVIVIVNFVFNQAFHSLALYNLSLIVPIM